MLAINKKIYKILKGISNNDIPKCDNKNRLIPLLDHLLLHGYILEEKQNMEERTYILTDKGKTILKGLENKETSIDQDDFKNNNFVQQGSSALNLFKISYIETRLIRLNVNIDLSELEKAILEVIKNSTSQHEYIGFADVKQFVKISGISKSDLEKKVLTDSEFQRKFVFRFEDSKKRYIKIKGALNYIENSLLKSY